MSISQERLGLEAADGSRERSSRLAIARGHFSKLRPKFAFVNARLDRGERPSQFSGSLSCPGFS
jgi:hypothetical protein